MLFERKMPRCVKDERSTRRSYTSRLVRIEDEILSKGRFTENFIDFVGKADFKNRGFESLPNLRSRELELFRETKNYLSRTLTSHPQGRNGTMAARTLRIGRITKSLYRSILTYH
jgi:hypothetical protein